MTPAAKRRLKQLAIAGVVALGLEGAMQWRDAARQQAAAAQQARVESVGYYRVRASYTVKATGEAIGFDYVAACATVVTMYRDGDRSVDTPFGIAPKMMFAPTRDGHAIQLVTPRACNDEVKDGFILPDLIPLTIFHDSVDNLAFGWGYTSQDAYDNARSRLGFEGASVTAATYTDFLAWRAKAAAGFTPVGQIRSPWGYSGERGSELKVSRGCDFYIRTPVFAAGRPALTAEWERRGKPEFWIVGDGMRRPEFWDEFRSQDVMVSHLHPRTKGGGVGTIGLYSNQRWGKIHYLQDGVFPSNEAYPYLPISLSSTPPPGLDSTVFPRKVPVSDDWKGLAACGKNDPAIDDVFFYNGRFSPSGHLDNYERDRYKIEPIGNRTRPFLANDTVVMLIPQQNPEPPRLFFQRDEFVLTPNANALEGILP